MTIYKHKDGRAHDVGDNETVRKHLLEQAGFKASDTHETPAVHQDETPLATSHPQGHPLHESGAANLTEPDEQPGLVMPKPLHKPKAR